MEGFSNEYIPSPEEELGRLRNKISDTFKAEGLTSEVYDSIEEWERRKEEFFRVGEDTGIGIENVDSLRHQIERAEIWLEIGDRKRLEECIEDLHTNWESFIEQFGEESEYHKDFRQRLNRIVETLDGPIEPQS